jgi:hypothetical protein
MKEKALSLALFHLAQGPIKIFIEIEVNPQWLTRIALPHMSA